MGTAKAIEALLAGKKIRLPYWTKIKYIEVERTRAGKTIRTDSGDLFKPEPHQWFEDLDDLRTPRKYDVLSRAYQHRRTKTAGDIVSVDRYDNTGNRGATDLYDRWTSPSQSGVLDRRRSPGRKPGRPALRCRYRRARGG